MGSRLAHTPYSPTPHPHPAMADITIYTTAFCPYCFMAKRLLTEKGASFREIDVTGDRAARAELRAKAGGRTTVPQIWIGDTARRRLQRARRAGARRPARRAAGGVMQMSSRGLSPGSQGAAHSVQHCCRLRSHLAARGWLDRGDKPRDDNHAFSIRVSPLI